MRTAYCRCEKHTDGNGNPTACGKAYITFGHYGWGEPYSRARYCEDCDSCQSLWGHGLDALEKSKQDPETWVRSSGPDTLLGQTSFLNSKTSYAIRARLPPKFNASVFLKNANITLNGPCGNDFLFETEVAGVWEKNPNTNRWELKGHNYHPMEGRWALDPQKLHDDVKMSKPTCPLCGFGLDLMMHEGWISAPAIGYGKEPRPIRVYYLSCSPDYAKYSPNDIIGSNQFGRPFNPHQIVRGQWASFWHHELRYT